MLLPVDFKAEPMEMNEEGIQETNSTSLIRQTPY